MKLLGKQTREKSPEERKMKTVSLRDELKAGRGGERNKQMFHQPIKGIKMEGSRRGKTPREQYSSQVNMQTDIAEDLKQDSIMSTERTRNNKKMALTLDNNCLSCTGQPA